MIEKLLANNISNKLYMLGFAFAYAGYSYWHKIEDAINLPEEKHGAIWGLCIAFAFLCYTSAYLFTNWNKWRWFPLFVVLICITRVITEIYFLFDDDYNPEKYDIFEYISFLLTIYIVISYWIKSKMSNKT